MNRKLFFDHIPKTAGTSLQQFFVEAFGKEKVTEALKGLKHQHALSVYANRQVITGHFYFTCEESLPEGYLWATVLRDPRERTLSEYFYIVNDVPDRGGGPIERRIKSMSLEEALHDSEFCDRIRNYQSVHFASFFHSTPWQLDRAEFLRLAKKGLEQYHLVGITERLEEFVEVLKKVFNIPEEIRLKRYNVTSRRERFSDLPSSLQARILELVDVDMELWQYAEELFENKTKHFDASSLPSDSKSEAQACKMASSVSSPIEPAGIQGDGSLELLSVTVSGQLRPQMPTFLPGERAFLRIAFRAVKDIDDLTVGYSIHHDSGLHIFGINTRLLGKKLSVKTGGEYYVDFLFPVNLGLGKYFVNISAHSGLTHLERCYLWREKVASFDVDGFADVLFEGLVRLMPSMSAGLMSGEGRLEWEQTSVQGVQRIGYDTPPISDCRGFIRCMPRIETLELRPGQQIAITVEVMNQSQQIWYLEGNKPVYLSYHWLKKEAEPVIFDGFRTPLPCNEIQPGELVQATAMVEALKQAGEYTLELTLVQEGVTWFEERGFVTERLAIKID
ncbi:MAG: Wzt carbohydrate-binding domain-containing protein [Thermodesulforhabdaceae bacterium]